MADDSANPRLLWKRPEGCTCTAELRGPGTPFPNGDYRLLRVIDAACPFHGDAATRVETAVRAALDVIRTTPGLPRVDEATLRRVMVAIYPILTGAAAPPTTVPGTTPEPGSSGSAPGKAA